MTKNYDKLRVWEGNCYPNALVQRTEGIAMYFLGIGIILLTLKYLEMGPVAQWSWWWVLSPFALAVIWWAWADSSGYTKKKAMEKMDKRKADRQAETRERLGMGTRRK